MPAYTTDSGGGGERRQIVATALLLLLAVAVAFLPSAQQQQIASVIRGTVLRPFVLGQEGLTHARSRATDSETLRRQLDSLVAITATHWVLAEENRRLRGLLEVRSSLGASWIPATVVRPGTGGSESMFILDVGREDGVEPYSPVIGRQGLVGVVREVRARSALAMDWSHPDFAVSAMDPDGITYGIVASRRGEFREADRLEFNGTAFHARLEDGTVIVTSGLAGVWPRGVAVGKIEGLAEADAGWRKSYWLRPMVEVGSVTHVLVGVGPEARGDLSGVWPADAFTEAELGIRLHQQQDSLSALRDSIALLRVLLSSARPVRDSVLAALLLGGASVQEASAWARGATEDSATAGPAAPAGEDTTRGAATAPAGAPDAPSGGPSPGTSPAREPLRDAPPRPVVPPVSAPVDTVRPTRLPGDTASAPVRLPPIGPGDDPRTGRGFPAGRIAARGSGEVVGTSGRSVGGRPLQGRSSW